MKKRYLVERHARDPGMIWIVDTFTNRFDGISLCGEEEYRLEWYLEEDTFAKFEVNRYISFQSDIAIFETDSLDELRDFLIGYNFVVNL